MRPILFHLGSIEVPSFFFMVMIATLSATFYASWHAKKEGADPVVLLDFGIISIIASVLGSRIFHIIIENPSYYLEKPIRVFYFWQGGFVSVGAFTFTVAGMLIYLRVRRLNFFRYLDIAAVAVPVAIFFVRVGCLSAGCCYGKPTDFFFHLVFNNPNTSAGQNYLGIPLHAAQIYDMLNALFMAVILYLIKRYKQFHGQMFAIFLLYYGVSRFFIEFLRGDRDRGLFFNNTLSTGQISMIIFFIAGVIIYVMQHKKGRL